MKTVERLVARYFHNQRKHIQRSLQIESVIIVHIHFVCVHERPITLSTLSLNSGVSVKPSMVGV
jgi:hypothetical protein